MKAKAKELFYRYGGNHGRMHHDGVWNEYQSYSVTVEQEAEWFAVLEKRLLTQVQSNLLVDESFHKLVDVIKFSRSKISFFSLLQVLLNNARESDSFSQLLASELLLDTANFLKREKVFSTSEIVGSANKIAALVASLSVESFSVAEYYKKGAFLPNAFSVSSIEKRIERLIKAISDLIREA